MDTRYRIEGILPLRGEVRVSGAKNAALPCMCAALLTTEDVVLRNVPDIADVHALLKIFAFLGVTYAFDEHTLTINARSLESKTIPHELVGKFRAAILLLGPLLARFGEVTMAYPGGCIIGKRPIGSHVDAFVQLGIENLSTEETIHLRGTLRSGEVILPEFSVTATENVLLAIAGGQTEVAVHIAAAEPHVTDLCLCLQAMGARIAGIGTHDLLIKGRLLHGAPHTVTTDYLEAGFFALAGVLTGGDLRIVGPEPHHLHAFLNALTRLHASWKWEERNVLSVAGNHPLQACTMRTNIFPGFPTDLQAAFGVAMTQAHGVSRIFERMFEGRFGYLFELEKMGGHVEILNAHEALLIGPTPLRGRMVSSNDIRAGAAMVLAALCARGETLVTDVQYIERGYENLPAKLRMLGASIERLEGDEVHSVHTHGSLEWRHERHLPKSAGVAASLPN